MLAPHRQQPTAPFERIQQDPAVREAVEVQCTPSGHALLAFPGDGPE